MVRDHLEFLCNVSEMSSAFAASSDSAAFFRQLVQIVARHLLADVCSIYVYDADRNELTMHANVGLRANLASPVRLAIGSGLIGTVFEQRAPIVENHASNHPRYKWIPDIGEEQYDSFLAVPLVAGGEGIGVIAVQRKERDHFSDDDLTALKVVASQLAGCINSARALTAIGAHTQAVTPQSGPQMIRAKVIANGTVIGKSRVYRSSASVTELLAALPSTTTLQDFCSALRQTTGQIEHLQSLVAKRLPEAVSLIFSAHLMILKDRYFSTSIADGIRGGKSVAAAIVDVLTPFRERLLASSSALIREKVQDLDDVGVRLVRNLLASETSVSAAEQGDIFIAREILPSELVMLSLEEPAGLILVEGAATSHVAILARSLCLPLYITDSWSVLDVPDETLMLMDGYTGNIYVSPSPATVATFKAERAPSQSSHQVDSAPTYCPAVTADGTRIEVRANINLLSEIPLVQHVNADGIGLYRTEFPFMIRNSFPDEEEQYLVYRRLVQAFSDQTVTFRTLDVGGDKTLSYSNNAEENPELGLRGIRFSLRHPDVFEQQLKAILRAGVDCPELRIMFPMVSAVDQFQKAIRLTHQAIDDLERSGTPTHPSPQIGLMLETPSVIETIDEFAEQADFFSIGSNDFVQYMLAADRGNEDMAEYYEPHHPSVVRALDKIIRAANYHNVPISICGEMAQQLRYLPLLIGLGLREFSVSPNIRSVVCRQIEAVDVSCATEHANLVLQQSTVKGIERVLGQWRQPRTETSARG